MGEMIGGCWLFLFGLALLHFSLMLDVASRPGSRGCLLSVGGVAWMRQIASVCRAAVDDEIQHTQRGKRGRSVDAFYGLWLIVVKMIAG
ncbi:hypothetical protein B0T22DRAFT_473320 [Podospora appendiculata]|uniref:Secreted protein n=1 Tax=Podospora appendiculata TaxID=314037 RepID=A0AAE1C7F5_9PEZI|nr:hypothetical protein B0T22DRAFT_473320 [Podospora appendiculata]